MYFRTYCFSLNQVVVVIYLKKVGVCVCVRVCLFVWNRWPYRLAPGGEL